jgi:hypothetical protein
MFMSRNEMSKFGPLSVLAAMLLLAPTPAEAGEYRNLCTSASKACVYTGPVAPALRAAVCWNGADLRLKGSGNCATGSWPYHVDFGEIIDPVQGLVVAYIPLDDACDLDICVEFGSLELDPLASEPLCCNPSTDDCTLNLQGQCPNGEILVWCEQPATNEDGSVACYN